MKQVQQDKENIINYLCKLLRRGEFDAPTTSILKNELFADKSIEEVHDLLEELENEDEIRSSTSGINCNYIANKKWFIRF